MPSETLYQLQSVHAGRRVQPINNYRTKAEAQRDLRAFRRYIHRKGVAYRVKMLKSPVQNPGPSAIPARWTPATVSRKGGQIQIWMGGR
jgi:hypothetical protein